MFCAVPAAPGGADTCTGDSGGPVLWAEGGDAPALVGLVSWGRGCGGPAGVYTRLSAFAGWIDRVVATGSG